MVLISSITFAMADTSVGLCAASIFTVEKYSLISGWRRSERDPVLTSGGTSQSRFPRRTSTGGDLPGGGLCSTAREPHLLT